MSLSSIPLVEAPAGFRACKSREMSGKGLCLKIRNPCTGEFPKSTIRNTPCFTSASSDTHLRTVFVSCQQLFSSSTLLLVSDESTRNMETSHIRTQHRATSKAAFFAPSSCVQRTELCKPLRCRFSSHSTSGMQKW